MKTEKEKKVVEIKIEDILPNRFQPRIKFDEVAINDLSASIKEHGVIQPLVVRKIGDKFEIIAGERRYKASVMAGLETVPAIVTDLNDKDSAEVALIENVQRQNLTPIEEAVSYKKILDMGYLTQEQLADKLGKSQSSIANKLRLLNLDDDVQEALLNGQISERHARSLLKLTDPKKQVEMLDRIIDERLTVRRTDEEIDKMLNDLFSSNDFRDEDNSEDIEQTQPLKFNFETDSKEEKENIFDKDEEEKESLFGPINSSPTDFFGLNQNIMSDDDEDETEEDDDENEDAVYEKTFEPIKDEYENRFDNASFIDVDKIENEAEDLYPKEEQKDINSFLEPTLLMDDIDDVKPLEPSESMAETSENSVEPDESNVETNEENIEEEKKDIELDEGMRPGKFFNLFNSIDDTEDEPNYSAIFGVNKNEEKPETKEEQINEEIPSQNEDNNIDDTTNEESAIIEDLNSNDSELEEIVPQKLEAEDITPLNTKEDGSNIDLALEKIRAYAEELKKLGIDMNIEESDFENKYQITINIDK